MIDRTRPTRLTLPTPRGRSRRRALSPPVDLFGHPDPTEPGSLNGLLPCWWAAAELRPWWAQEVAGMQAGYPGFRPIARRRHRELARVLQASANGGQEKSSANSERERVEHEQCGELVLAWRGVMAPFPADMSGEDIQAIVSDLDEDRPVRVMADGVLAHYAACGGTHRPRPGLRLARVLRGAFSIEIAYRTPPGCPIARSLWPRIDQHHPSGPPPHLLNTIDALCVLFPADGAWVWGAHGARQYAHYVAIWLAKHLAWIEARERGIGIEAAWPGSAVGHEPTELARLLAPADICRCGSGKSYGTCCRPRDHALNLRGRGENG